MGDVNQEGATIERSDVSSVVVRGSSVGFAQEILAAPLYALQRAEALSRYPPEF
jgi:hypothetical protein